MQRGAHLLELLGEPVEELPLDRVRGTEVEDEDLGLLADAMDPAHALL